MSWSGFDRRAITHRFESARISRSGNGGYS